MWTKCLLQRAPSSHLWVQFQDNIKNFVKKEILSQKHWLSHFGVTCVTCRWYVVMLNKYRNLLTNFHEICWTAFAEFKILDQKFSWFMTKQNLSYQSTEANSRISRWLWLKMKMKNTIHFREMYVWTVVTYIYRSLGLTFYCFWPRHHDPNLSVLPEIKKKMKHITGYLPHIINHSPRPLYWQQDDYAV